MSAAPRDDPGAWVPSPNSPSVPSTHARVVSGSAEERGMGAQRRPGSRAVILLRNSLVRASRTHLAALPAHLPRKRRANCGPKQAPEGGTQCRERGEHAEGIAGEHTWRPRPRGAGRTWLSHLARPRLPSRPLLTRLHPLPSLLTSAVCPQISIFAPSHPIHLGGISPTTTTTCFHSRHPREGREPDVRPVAKRNWGA